jgi:serine/threonine protein kinase
MITFLCSGCGKSLKVKDELAGRKGRCPHCQRPMTVPTLAGASRERAEQAGQINRGELLETQLKRERKLPLDEAVRIVKEIAEGLADAHERGMIHGNLKPANIWLEGETRRVKILDLGTTRPERDEASLRRAGADIATVAYLAPEQSGGGSVDTRCDLFSLGVVFYRMVTGTLPFKAADAASTLAAIATGMPTAPRKLNADLSPRMSRLIMELMAKDPDDRAPSALSVVDLLDELEREPAQVSVGIVGERRAGAPTLRADDFDRDTFDDEALDVEPKKRSPMVPLLIGGGVGCFGLLVIALIGGIVLFKKSDTPEVAQNNNPPVENNAVAPPPIDQNLNPPPNPNQLGNPKPDDRNKAGNPNLGGNDGGIKDPPKNNVEEKPIEPPPRKAGLRDADTKYKLHSSAVKGLLFAPDGKHVFSFAERTTKVDYWDLDTGKTVRSFELGGNQLTANVKHFSISKDGSRLIAFNSGLLLCWEVESGKPLVSVTAPAGTVVCGGGFTADKDVRAALSAKLPAGSNVAIYDHGLGKLIPLINPKTNKPVINPKTKKPEPLSFPHPGTEVELVLFSPDSKRFVSWSQDHMFRTWDIEQVRLVATSPAAPGDLKAVAVSPDFKHLMGAFNQHEFHVYDVEAGKEVKEIKPEGLGNTDALAYGGDGTIGVAARFGGNTSLYDVEEGTLKKEVKGIAFTTAMALSPDGKTVLCGDIHGTIYVFKLVE